MSQNDLASNLQELRETNPSNGSSKSIPTKNYRQKTRGRTYVVEMIDPTFEKVRREFLDFLEKFYSSS